MSPTMRGVQLLIKLRRDSICSCILFLHARASSELPDGHLVPAIRRFVSLALRTTEAILPSELRNALVQCVARATLSLTQIMVLPELS